MTDALPTKIAIDHDDYRARHVGRMADGRQFFLTTPFEPALDDRPGCEYVALYVFDTSGMLLDAIIDDLGPRESLDQAEADECHKKRLDDLGDVTFRRIEVRPFAVDRFGVTFGLVPQYPDPDDGSDEPCWTASVLPGDYMSFYAPWDSGVYDT